MNRPVAAVLLLGGIVAVCFGLARGDRGGDRPRAATPEAPAPGPRTDDRSITVAVLMPDGSPAPGATVVCTSEDGRRSNSWTWSSRMPGSNLDRGTWTVTAEATVGERGVEPFTSFERRRLETYVDYREAPVAPFAAEPQLVRVESGVQSITMRLVPRPGIVVRLRRSEPVRNRDMRVAAVKIEPGAAAPRASSLLSHRARAAWLCGTASLAVLAGLEPGDYLVGVSSRGGRIGSTARVTVGPGLTDQEFAVDSDPGDDFVRVRVVDEHDAPLPGAEFEHGVTTRDGSAMSTAEATPVPDGAGLVPHFSTDSPSFGVAFDANATPDESLDPRYFIDAVHPVRGRERVYYAPGVDREITIRLSKPARASIRIEGLESADELRRAVLYVTPEGGAARNDALVVPEGRVVEVSALRPGVHEVALLLADSDGDTDRWLARHHAPCLARTRVSLVAGDNAIVVRPVRLGELAVVTKAGDAPPVLDPMPGSIDGRTRIRPEALAANRWRFTGLAPGAYRISTPFGEMSVEMPATGVVEFAPRPYNACRLTVMDESYAASAGLRTGDLVVGIDGVEFGDRAGMDVAFARARANPTSTLMLLRSGARIDVTLDAKQLVADRSLTMDPAVR